MPIPVEDEIIETMQTNIDQYGEAVGFALVSFHENGMAFCASYYPNDTDAARMTAHIQAGIEETGRRKKN